MGGGVTALSRAREWEFEGGGGQAEGEVRYLPTPRYLPANSPLRDVRVLIERMALYDVGVLTLHLGVVWNVLGTELGVERPGGGGSEG
eukprot:3822015-Rhodomonas_salina.1